MSKKNKKSGVLEFKFKKSDKIGASAAEEDKQFLADCFVDPGCLNEILDVGSSKCIIVGRTGAGKSALLEHIKMDNAENAICIAPEDIALRFLSTTMVIPWVLSQNIRLNPLFKLLWRHVIAVELVRHISVGKK